MKAAAVVLAAGSLVSSVLATPHDRHMAYHNRRNQEFPPFPIVERSEPEACGCTTYTTWVTVGTGGLVQPSSSQTTSLDSTVYITPSPMSTPSPSPVETPTSVETPSTPATVPTPYETSFSTTGTYTVTGTSTITLTSTHTAPTPTSTVCEGTCSYGGVTTSVTTETTVTCPYATTSVTGGVTTSIITSTTYTCPSGGEYTIIPPTTVTVTQPSTISYPTTTHYPPGTYTQPTTTVTVTKTEETFTCPYESVTPVPLPKPTSVSVPPQPQTTSVYVPPKPSTTSIEVPPKPSTTAVEVPPKPTETYSPPEYTPSPSPKPKPSPKPQPGPITNGNQWAMTYTPYDNAGGCKSAGAVMADIAKISALGFTTVRTYSTDCDTLSSVGNACKANGMKMILGVFIDESGIAGAQEQVTDILGWAQWDLVEIVVVGNEAMFNGYTTASELSGFISKVKGQLSGAGCSAPVTTTEPVDIMQEYGSQLCGAMDVFGVNIQPYFDANTSPSSAGEFVLSQLGLVKNICPGMETYNFECGWPHSGGANGAAITGISQQAEAIASIVEKAGSKTAIFSFTDDMWKSPGYNGVEQYFGASQCF